MLMGDLAFTWPTWPWPRPACPTTGWPPPCGFFNRLRSELMGGQYLDLVEARRGAPEEDAVRRVLTYKSGKYTIERPLHLGLALAAGPPTLAAGYFGLRAAPRRGVPARDDLLGVFVLFEVTAGRGRPARGARDLPGAAGLPHGADRAGRALLEGALGNAKLSEEEVAELRRLIAGCGAVDATEASHRRAPGRGCDALAAARGIDEAARATLAALADHVTDRNA